MLENQLFWNVLIIVSSIIELWSCKKVFDYTSESRYKKIRINFIFILIVGLMLLLFYLNISPNIRIGIALILTFLFYLQYYEVKVYTAVIVTLIYWIILLITDALSMSLTIWINSLDVLDHVLMNNIYRVQSIVLGKSILLLLLGIYRLVRSEMNFEKKDVLYLGMPLITNIFSFFIVFKYVFKFSDLKIISPNEMMYISIILILSSISLLIVIKKVKKDSQRLAQKDILKRTLEMQYQYYMNLKENHDRVRQLHHDMKNHLICIQQLHQSGYNNDDYIAHLEDKIQNLEIGFDTGSILLDMILSEKREICKKKDIKFTGHINFTRCQFISSEDICSIFSNILDNAIEACDKINRGDKFIAVDGIIVKNVFVLKVENSKTNQIKRQYHQLITDKNDSFIHGLGIKNIKESVKKYDGETMISYTADKFTIKILIPLKN